MARHAKGFTLIELLSAGDILRLGGVKPPGRIFDVLYAATTK